MSKQFILKGLLAIAVTLSLFSCDKDFNTIGSEIVGDENLAIQKREFYDLQTGYDVTNAVQSSNLPLNSLGVYKNPAFGTAKSSFVSQAELSSLSPTTGINPQIDSVWVYVPYFSTQDGMEDDNVYRKYTLDSIYGDEIKFKLKIYENGYKLGDFDPNASDGILKHYSDERITKIEPYKKGTNALGDVVVNGDPLNMTSTSSPEYDQFYFSNKEHILFRTNQNGDFLDDTGNVIPDSDPITNRVVDQRFLPGMWINLNKEYFRKRILNAPVDKLANQTAFKDYFRGLFFEPEANGSGEGAMAMLDFTKGYIQIEYSYGVEVDSDNNPDTPPVVETERSALRLNLKGNTVNLFDNDYDFNISNRLYVVGGGKGATGTGNGSTAFIDVFGNLDADSNGVPDNLDYIRAQGWLINEANLTFYVDDEIIDDSEATNASLTSKQKAPFRLYLYDSKNSKPVVDYSADPTVSPLGSKYNKYIYGGILQKKDGKGHQYKFRITEYLRSCIRNTDSTNFRLRLGVSQNIHNVNNAYLKNPVGSPQVKLLPVSSVIYPLGTILHSPTSENTEKRLKLEIYYTKPE